MTISFQTGDLESADVEELVSYHFNEMQLVSPRDACHVLAIEALREESLLFWSMRDKWSLGCSGRVKGTFSRPC